MLVVQRRMTHYRVPFFESLRRKLDQADLELVLAYGQGTPSESSKEDGGELSWALPLATHYLGGGRVCYQPFGEAARDCELVVVTLENKLLCNLTEQFLQRGRRVALWGHGANLQGDPGSLRERFKRRVARQADWWFGYTSLSVPLITRSGFPEERITVLNNAVDTSRMREDRAALDVASIAARRAELGLEDAVVGIYVGSLYPEKRIPFLLQSAEAIRARIPNFHLIVVGAGPEADSVRSFASRQPWVHYMGPRRDREKLELMALARVMLNPGLVGLGILDSFICEVPLLTTDCGLHSPEIAYLESGVNGYMTADAPDDFVDAAVRVLSDESLAARLQRGCAESGRLYTVEQMAERFAAGARDALAAPPHRFRGMA